MKSADAGRIRTVIYDGTRIWAGKQEGKAFVINRKNVDYTDRLTEIIEALKGIPSEDIIIDGEAVVYDANGRTNFEGSQRRCSTQNLAKQREYRVKYPIYLLSFDLVRLDGKDVRNFAWQTRKKLLEDLLKESLQESIKLAPHAYDEEKRAFYENAIAHGEEGVILKEVHSPYVGKRSRYWLKVKKWYSERCRVVGYTEGTGKRDNLFGSLMLARPDDDGYLVYCGKVGSGFTDAQVRHIAKLLKGAEVETKPVDARNSTNKPILYTPVNIDLEVTVKFYESSKNGVFRFPSMLKNELGNSMIHFSANTIDASVAPKQQSLKDLLNSLQRE